MIDQIDRRLRDWIDSVIPDGEVSLQTLHHPSGKPSVSLYLMDLLPGMPAQSSRRPSLQIILRYLLIAWAEDAEIAHRMLGELVFAALEQPDFEVDLEPLPVQLWNAFSLAPQPSFKVKLPLRLERPEPRLPRVRRPAEVQFAAVTNIRGLVLGPDQLPLPNVRVELPSLQRTTLTDGKGWFQFTLIPADPPRKRFRIAAKGYEIFIDREHDRSGREPLVLHFDAAEV